MAEIPQILLMIEPSRTCEREFYRGIVRYVQLHGPWTFYHKPKFYLRSSRTPMPIEQIKNYNPDGIIISDIEAIDEILALGRPTIIHTFKSNTYPCPMVLGDTQHTGRMVAEHLLGLGYKHYAYCGIGDYYWSKGRFESFRQTIEKAGFEVFYHELNPHRILDQRQKELEQLGQWLMSLPFPLGLMACADDCSQLIMEACKPLDIRIPEQISLIGVDNDDMICEFGNPPVSSIALNFEAAGYQTAELLDRLITHNKRTPQNITVQPTHVEVRGSTDILATDDPDVTAAVRFIRTHANRLIQIADVMNEVTCCQRSLHQKFRRILGRSVYQEIKRVRVEKITRMLRETDWPIAQIAGKLGYVNTNHLSRFFRQETAMTPMSYRKQLTLKTPRPAGD